MRHRICFLDQEVMDLLLAGRRSFAIKRASECLTSVKRLLDREETKVEKRELIRKYFT